MSYEFFTSKEIRPAGWLLQQLKIEADGLVGNLDKVWPDVRDSAWIGGAREGWERVPYWLDGFIPLSYLLRDDDMIARAKKYIDAILSRQEDDGWICPCPPEARSTYDMWALMLISKVLTVYYDCSGDERIPEVLKRATRNFYDLLKAGEIKLFNWGKYRWFEEFIALEYLNKRYHEDWICELARLLKEQGADYAALTEKWKRPLNRWTFDTHIVNIAMMLKYEAVSCGLLGDKYTGIADKLYAVLKKFNGTPVGTFTGDECLSGLSPIQGTELCAVVEEMYSCELLYAATGNKIWAERLETVAFNALPAATSDDMWAHQYDQMSNQINCVRFPGKAIFRTNGSEAHLFGLEPNYGCCTANFGQGWPKLTTAAFMRRERTIISAVPLPSILETAVGGVGVKITLETDYPFRNVFIYRVETNAPVKMKLKIRVPSFAKNLIVNGEPTAVKGGYLVFDRTWQGITEVRVQYEVTPVIEGRPNGLKCVRAGSLVFALPIKYKKVTYEYIKKDVERKLPYCDYEYVGESDWQYSFVGNKLNLEYREGDDYPFSSKHPRVVLKAKLVPVNWGYEDGYDTLCAKKPASARPIGEETEKELYPYGCAKLRMTEMPLKK